jgi:hypothetical protein
MAAITTERINFGTGSVFETASGAATPTRVANLTDVSADFTIELKEAYSEGTWPIAIASGHGSITITAKHYTMNPTLLANATGGVISTGATTPQAVDEAYTVPAVSTYTVPLTNGGSGKLVAGTLLILAFPIVGGVAVPRYYSPVTAGSEVAGASYSVAPSTGIVTFAAGDAGVAFQASYSYTATTGSRVTVANSFQNSQKPMSLVAVKRDNSVDAGTAALIYTFPAVRAGGIKNGHQEDNFTVYERTYKAFANAQGTVWTTDFVNY